MRERFKKRMFFYAGVGSALGTMLFSLQHGNPLIVLNTAPKVILFLMFGTMFCFVAHTVMHITELKEVM